MGTELNMEAQAKLNKFALAKKLRADDLTDDDTKALEALGWRAMRSGCREVEDAVTTVLSALQGFYGLSSEEVDEMLKQPKDSHA